MDETNNTKDEEVSEMATLTNFRQSTIIQSSKTKEFLKVFNENRADKSYWDECKKTSRSISSSAMDALKRMCLGDENE